MAAGKRCLIAYLVALASTVGCFFTIYHLFGTRAVFLTGFTSVCLTATVLLRAELEHIRFRQEMFAMKNGERESPTDHQS